MAGGHSQRPVDQPVLVSWWGGAHSGRNRSVCGRGARNWEEKAEGVDLMAMAHARLYFAKLPLLQTAPSLSPLYSSIPMGAGGDAKLLCNMVPPPHVQNHPQLEQLATGLCSPTGKWIQRRGEGAT